MTLRAVSPTYLLWLLGSGFILAGIRYPTTPRLILSGAGLLFLAFLLDRTTAFGKDGPITLKEEATLGPDGKIQKLRYTTGLLNTANLLRLVGLVLTATGVFWQFNLALIIIGFVVAGAGLYLRGRKA